MLNSAYFLFFVSHSIYSLSFQQQDSIFFLFPFLYLSFSFPNLPDPAKMLRACLKMWLFSAEKSPFRSIAAIWAILEHFYSLCNENPIYVFCFPDKELHGLRPNFHIHVSVSYLYIPRIAEQAVRLWEYINRSQTHECGNWEWGRTIPFLGIFVSNSVLCLCSAEMAGEPIFHRFRRTAHAQSVSDCTAHEQFFRLWRKD